MAGFRGQPTGTSGRGTGGGGNPVGDVGLGRGVGGLGRGISDSGLDAGTENTGATEATKALIPFTDALKSALGGLLTVGAGVGGVVAGLASMTSAAAQWAAGAGMMFAQFQMLSSGVSGLLGALNPGLTSALQYSLRELQAAFALLVEPIARELAPLFRELAATLAPAFRALAPVIATLAQAFGAVLGTVAQVVAQIITALQPVLQILADLIRDVVTALAPLLHVFAALVAALAPVLAALVGALAPVIKWVASLFVQLAALLMKFLGMDKQLADMIKAIDPSAKRDESGGLQAVTNPQFQSATELGRSLMLSAVTATSGPGREKTQSEYLAELAADLKKIASGETTLVGMIADGVKQGMLALGGATYGESAKETVDAMKSGDVLKTLANAPGSSFLPGLSSLRQAYYGS